MNNDEMVTKLDQAIALTTEVRNSLAGTGPEPPGTVIDLTPGQSIQSALDAAPAGSTFRLAEGVYDGALRIGKPAYFIPPNPPVDGTATRVCPVFLTSRAEQTVLVTPDAVDVRFLGIGFKQQTPDYELVLTQGTSVLFDRCTALGDPENGQRRAWRVEGKKTRILGCYANDIFRPGRDTCVIGSWKDTDGLEVDGCYLCGGAETIMFGGADAPSADQIPKNIRITNSTLTKNPAWYAKGAQLKTPFELKCAEHVYMGNCHLEYGGVSEGQGAYLMVLTVRNQGGKAPWSCISDVLIENCACRLGGGGVSFLGHDDNYESGFLDGVLIRNCAFTEMSPQGLWSQGGYAGSGRCAMFNNAPANITLEAITMDGTNMGALGYFANAPKQPTGLTLRNWKYCPTKYGWKIDAGSGDTPPASKNIKLLMPDLVYAVTANDPGAQL